MLKKILPWITFLIITLKASGSDETLCVNSTISEDLGIKEEPSKLLSRRKRYLNFPDGSSFQLGNCYLNNLNLFSFIQLPIHRHICVPINMAFFVEFSLNT